TGVGGVDPEVLSGEVETPHDVEDVTSLARSVTGERRRALAQFVAVWLDMREKHWPTHSPEAFGKLKKGDLVLVFTHRPRKLDVSWRGPYPVLYRGRRFLGLQTPAGVEEHHLTNCKPYVIDADEPEADSEGGGGPLSVPLDLADPLSAEPGVSRPQSDLPRAVGLQDQKLLSDSDQEDRFPRPRKRKAAIAAEKRLQMVMREEAHDSPLRPRRSGPKRARIDEEGLVRAISVLRRFR
ncbi:hypothetical protein FOZ63_009068, partial [Perkinsus olseni]